MNLVPRVDIKERIYLIYKWVIAASILLLIADVTNNYLQFVYTNSAHVIAEETYEYLVLAEFMILDVMLSVSYFKLLRTLVENKIAHLLKKEVKYLTIVNFIFTSSYI